MSAMSAKITEEAFRKMNDGVRYEHDDMLEALNLMGATLQRPGPSRWRRERIADPHKRIDQLMAALRGVARSTGGFT